MHPLPLHRRVWNFVVPFLIMGILVAVFVTTTRADARFVRDEQRAAVGACEAAHGSDLATVATLRKLLDSGPRTGPGRQVGLIFLAQLSDEYDAAYARCLSKAGAPPRR